MTYSTFMGFPVLWRDDGGREELPNGLLPGPAEHLFGLDIPVGDDSVGIHSDKGIERRFDNAARMCLVLPQRHFRLHGAHMFLLHTTHAPQQESKRWDHY